MKTGNGAGNPRLFASGHALPEPETTNIVDETMLNDWLHFSPRVLAATSKATPAQIEILFKNPIIAEKFKAETPRFGLETLIRKGKAYCAAIITSRCYQDDDKLSNTLENERRRFDRYRNSK